MTATSDQSLVFSQRPAPWLYVLVLAALAFLAYLLTSAFGHALLGAPSLSERLSVLAFCLFVMIAAFSAFHNIAVLVFGASVKLSRRRLRVRQLRSGGDAGRPTAGLPRPRVALLYTTCNDFSEDSVFSLVSQHYEAFTVYILDDGDDPSCAQRIDAFAARHGSRVRVVRRRSRRGYKAGNLNNCLRNIAVHEPYFALADADEVLPPDFLQRAVQILDAHPSIGFVQASHGHNPRTATCFAAELGPGVDAHYRWYYDYRNRFGFVMLLGHGALIRRAVWESIGGFPEVVSEDLAFAIRARDAGWRGYFAADLLCLEDFPATLGRFRVRHMKWVCGTCQLLATEFGRLLQSRRITLVEKVDVLVAISPLVFSAVVLPLTIALNWGLATFVELPATAGIAASTATLSHHALSSRYVALGGAGLFFLMTLGTFASTLIFVVDMANQPRQLAVFIAKSVVVYGALVGLSVIGVASYLLTGRARFFVTGESDHRTRKAPSGLKGLPRSHPDRYLVRCIEATIGASILGFAFGHAFHASLVGLGFGVLGHSILHQADWNVRLSQWLVAVPPLLVFGDVLIGGLLAAGIRV